MSTATLTGRPRVLGPSQRELLRQLREAEPTLGVRRLTVQLIEACGIQVSASTVSAELRRQGYVHTRRVTRSVTPPKPQPDPPSGETSPKRKRGYSAPPDLMPPSFGFRKAYPTDLSDTEWALLEPYVPPSLPGGRPECWPRRELVNAMFYVLRNGCTWRALPHDFPPHSTVYGYFRRWRDAGIWQRVNDALRPQVRIQAGRNPTPSAASVDSQSVKTTEKRGSAVSTAANA